MVIYKIVDSISKKGYVGKTVRNFDQRRKEHLKLLENNRHHNQFLQNIFNKDRKRISFEILEDGINSLEELNEKEIRYIEEQGTLNIAKGGEGGDTISSHPYKQNIFKKRSEQNPTPRGKNNPNYKEVGYGERKVILEEWRAMPIKILKELAKKTGISQYLCRRVLIESGETIENRHETQKLLRQAGILVGSRNPKFTQEQIEYIKKRYLQDWIGCKQIAKELGFRSESPILRIVEEYNIKRSKSEWTTYNNLKRKNKNE